MIRRREVYTKHTCSLGFQDIRQGVTLQRVTYGDIYIYIYIKYRGRI